MYSVRTRKATLCAAGTALLFLTGPGILEASSIPMPAGSRSWILVGAGDCDDDGPNANVDRGHCIGAVSNLDTPGDVGHGQIANYNILVNASVGPETFRGSIAVNLAPYTFLDMSMIDTYTLNSVSSSVPAGTVVPVTVSFHAVGTLTPFNYFSTAWGGGFFGISIGTTMNPDPIVIPENTRVQGILGPDASKSLFIGTPNPGGGAIVPLDLLATHTMNVTVGTPFDLAFYMGVRPSASQIDFSHTATIGFSVPEGTIMTSTGGFGQVVPVQPTTWSGLKARYN
jgi:hypothetical protein